MATNISIRMQDADLEMLDRLVVAVRARYERMAEDVPAMGQVARETTRSSALRDLLLAWQHGKADELFSRDLTAKADD